MINIQQERITKMNHYTKQDILRLAEEEDIEFIRLQFTDVFGTLDANPLPP